MSPVVSVLMAVHNGGAYLDESIRSIVRQSFPEWELVIVDDASTDDSAAAAKAWASRDRRIRVFSNTSNLGQTVSLNTGLLHCRGEWVARQDADDVSYPERLRLQLERVTKQPQIALLGSQGKLISGRGGVIGLLDVPEDGGSVDWCAPFLNPFLHTAVLFRRDLVTGAGGYDESYRISQDYELWTRLAAVYPVANLSQRLISYRCSEGSLSILGRNLTFAEADRVSDRESRRWLGRSWTVEEGALVSEFRKGLESARHYAFWRLIAALEQEVSSPLPAKLRASWHLRLAGAGRSVHTNGILSAFRAAPFFTARWFFDRFFSF